MSIVHFREALSLATNKLLLLHFAHRLLFPGPMFPFFSWKVWGVGDDIFSCYLHASFLVTVGSLAASRKPSHRLGLVIPDSRALAPLPAGDKRVLLLQGPRRTGARAAPPNAGSGRSQAQSDPWPQETHHQLPHYLEHSLELEIAESGS